MQGDASGAERIAHLRCERDAEPDLVTLGVAVQACARSGDQERAEAIFNTSLSRGSTRPEAISFNHLFNASGKAKDMFRAEF
jgi:hypothetical protein